MEKKPRITYQKNGPYIVHDVDKVVDSDGTLLVKKQERRLCRCGGSRYKPFCDGSHIDIGFEGDYAVSVKEVKKVGTSSPSDELLHSETEKANSEPPKESGIIIEKNGPYTVQGGIEIESVEKQPTAQQHTICRCGGSGVKPLCDGTHTKIGFRDDHLLAIIRVDAVEEELTRVTIGKKELVVIKRDSGLSVFSGVCLHAEALLVEGFIEENYLTCGRHRWRYNLETGQLDGDPSMALKKLQTKFEDGWLLIEKAELNELADLEDD
ncbi:MAG: CDGSH iron-sulfur domain-containing protein [Proteobacteria bacterium]|nr:CDGSH iron-sulfur domain-containing protein [Pseudomonadota bacterium]